MSEPDSPQFFVVDNGPRGSVHDTEFLRADGSNYGEAPRCPACLKFVGMREWLKPYRVEITAHGGAWGDFAFFGGEFLVSVRAASTSTDSKLTGLVNLLPAEPVKVRGGQDRPVYLRTPIGLQPGSGG